MGIASDIFQHLSSFLNGGRPVDAQYVTSGDGGGGPPPKTPLTGVNHRILPDTNYIVPAFTITNNGSANAYWAVSGGGVWHTLYASGGSSTYRWKNPRELNLVFNDGGTATVIDVTG
jgi:hypothetical protein